MDSLSWAILVSSVLSLMGSATVIGFHMAIPANQRTHIFRLVLWLMVAEFFKALTSFISVWINTEASFICLIIAITTSLTDCASLFWTVCIAYTLHSAVFGTPGSQNRDQEPLMKKYHLFVWGSSGFLTLLPLLTNSYGEAGGWCWITDDDTISLAMRYIQLYGTNPTNPDNPDRMGFADISSMNMISRPLWIIMGYLGWVYAKIYKKFVDKNLDAVAKRCIMYPLVLLVCWAFPTFNRLNQIFHPGVEIGWLIFMHALMAGLTGFFNSLAYGVTENLVVTYFKSKVRELCSCCYEDVYDERDNTGAIQLEDEDESMRMPHDQTRNVL